MVPDVFSQYKELGLGAGTFNYTGDLVRGYDFAFSRPAVHFFYRRNSRDFISFRYQLTYGRLEGNDNDPIDILALQRRASFDISILEGSAVVEYNFLDFRNESATTTFTPYFYGGIGLMRMFGVEEQSEDFSLFQPVIPLGVGIKQRINNSLNIGIEFGPRVVFTDFLDNVSGGDPDLRDFNYGNEFDQDWYYHFNITISYVFYSVPCVYPVRPNI